MRECFYNETKSSFQSQVQDKDLKHSIWSCVPISCGRNVTCLKVFVSSSQILEKKAKVTKLAWQNAEHAHFFCYCQSTCSTQGAVMFCNTDLKASFEPLKGMPALTTNMPQKDGHYSPGQTEKTHRQEKSPETDNNMWRPCCIIVLFSLRLRLAANTFNNV